MNFYTSVQVYGNNILYRGIIDGKRVKQKIDYSPSLFIPSKIPTEFKSLDGIQLKQKIFGTIKEAKEYSKKFEGISNSTKIYGNTNFEYAYIADHFKDSLDWDYDKVSIAVVDIEVGSENGFPDPYQANEPITAITITYINGITCAFGIGDYKVQGDETYIKCKDEWTLCKKFLDLWTQKTPDIISGWNTKFFDIPYLVNRFAKILGESDMKRLSPWGVVYDREVVDKYSSKPRRAYTLLGVASLDYMEMFKWFAKNGRSQENYRLDTIANVVLGENKLSYDEYGSLHMLYKMNHQKFIEYNIKDVHLIIKMDEKLRLFELALNLAYDSRSNFEDVFKQTRMWDSLCYAYLLRKNIIVPPKEVKEKDAAFEGAYVKEVLTGLWEWVASFDLDSLYPHLMMQYNISPEALIEPEDYTPVMRRIISQGVTVEKLLNKEIDLTGLEGATLTPNGQFFRTDIRGFLAQMMDEMYDDRKNFKNAQLKAEQDYENESDPVKKLALSKLIAKYNNMQNAKKVTLNSAYGAMGSKYFRFYDLRMATAITQAGQLSIRWIENKLNTYVNNILKTENDYVIASDTDSIYLNLGPIINKIGAAKGDPFYTISVMDKICNDKVKPYIDQSYNELASYLNAYEQKMKMKREALASKGIWTGKKHYILKVYNNEGVQYTEPKLKIMGLEVVKSSTPTIIREKMRDVIKLMVNENEDSVQKYIEQFRKEYDSLPAEDISFPRGMNGIDTYRDAVSLYKKGTPIHVKGAILYNDYLKKKGLTKKYPTLKEGDKLKFTYLKLPNPLKNSVISYHDRLPPEFELDQYVDYDIQFEKTFLEPIKTILDCIGWKFEKTSSLDAFFN